MYKHNTVYYNNKLYIGKSYFFVKLCENDFSLIMVLQCFSALLDRFRIETTYLSCSRSAITIAWSVGERFLTVVLPFFIVYSKIIDSKSTPV